MNAQKLSRSGTPTNRLFFGGSFDPPHQGHTQLPIEVAQSLDSAELIFVPAARSPFKAAHPTADHHRVAMLEIALQNQRNWDIWHYELNQAKNTPGAPSYWADSWNAVQLKYATGTNSFLIGADQARSIHRWKRFTEFWKDAIVMLRLEDSTESSLDFNTQRTLLLDQLAANGTWSDDELHHWKARIIKAPLIDASSTFIRSALAESGTRELPIDGLDLRVQEYILTQGLYI